jgi:CO/xanthine dehydrogenase Mo-binding subunit
MTDNGRDGHRGTIDPVRGGMLDAVERVTGRVPYTIDLQVPGMLHAKLLRSTMAHARIRSIDVARARAVPGVHVVLTGADLAGRPDIQPWYGPVFRDQPILAIDKVRYVGEPVAAVAAIDVDAAQAAIELIDVCPPSSRSTTRSPRARRWSTRSRRRSARRSPT